MYICNIYLYMYIFMDSVKQNEYPKIALIFNLMFERKNDEI